MEWKFKKTSELLYLFVWEFHHFTTLHLRMSAKNEKFDNRESAWEALRNPSAALVRGTQATRTVCIRIHGVVAYIWTDTNH
jgi:hypothetical protein